MHSVSKALLRVEKEWDHAHSELLNDVHTCGEIVREFEYGGMDSEKFLPLIKARLKHAMDVLRRD